MPSGRTAGENTGRCTTGAAPGGPAQMPWQRLGPGDAKGQQAHAGLSSADRSATRRYLALTDPRNIRAHALIVLFPLAELVVAVGTDKGKAALNCALETCLLRWLRVRHGRENLVEGRVRPAAIDDNPIGAADCLHACLRIDGGRRTLRKEQVQAGETALSTCSDRRSPWITKSISSLRVLMFMSWARMPGLPQWR